MHKNTLDGIRVVDMTWVLAGPMATKMLALMGAEVIKIESRLRPEHVRREKHSLVVNNNKKSCSLNITKPEGQALLRRLVAKSNVVTENFSNSVLMKYSLAYADLKQVRPDLIFVSGSGMGRSGPLSDVLAYGSLLQAYSGRATMIGSFNPRLEGMGISGWTDPITATWEGLALLAAIYHWRKTGLGSYVDLSMLECLVALSPDALFRELVPQMAPGTAGHGDPGNWPSGCYRCAGADDWVSISVGTDREWKALSEAIGTPGLAHDPRFADARGRQAHRDDLDLILGDWAVCRSAQEAEAVLVQAGVAASRSRNPGEAIVDEDLWRRGVFRSLGDGDITTGLPWRDADGWAPEIREAPQLGQDNEYVFGELLGLGSAQIEALVQAEVIY